MVYAKWHRVGGKSFARKLRDNIWQLKPHATAD